MLPHVRGRPLTLVRCPKSIADCAYLRHTRAWTHWPALRIIHVPEQKKIGEYFVADEAAALVSLVQMDILEIHTWNSTAEALERPDRIVIDLDPGEGVSWPALVAAAAQVREALARLGLASWLKTTGGKGLHVVIPLAPTAGWDPCLAFARGFAQELARAHPERFTASVAKHARPGRIYLDYLRNGRGNSAIAAFSVRARAGAPVSVPIAWEELGSRRISSSLRDVPRRLARLRTDPWKGYWRKRQRLPI